MKETIKAASDQVADQLREEIISGAIISGTSLVETEIATGYGVSRNTVREAVRQLRSEGLIVYIRHRGAIVRTLTPADVRDIYQVRRALELSAIEQSAFAGEGPLSAIRKVVESEEEAMTAQRWREVGTWSPRFHQSVVALLESERLDEFFKTIVAQLRLVFALTDDEKRFQSPWVSKDRRIHEALLRGQRREAADAMKLYLEESEAGVLDLVRSVRTRSKPSVK